MKQPMSMGAAFLSEFDPERDRSRRMIECIPEETFSWRPHPKSWTMGELATHLANLFDWIIISLETDSLDPGAIGGAAPRRETADLPRDLLQTFDRKAAAARSALAGASDEQLGKSWTLQDGDRALFTLPRITVLRNFVIHHGIHHRAQIGLYLRLNDVPVPGMYGPSADDSDR